MFTQTQTREEIITEHFNAEWSPVSAISPEAAQGYAEQFLARYPKVALVCGSRLAAAMRIMCHIGARRRGEQVGQFMVQSESNSRGWYEVDLLRRTCTCPDHPGVTAKGGICKHRLAVGLQIFGPDWITATYYQLVQGSADSVMRRTAEDAAAKAWAMHDHLTDQYITLGERFDAAGSMSHYFDADVQAAREAVQAAAHEAQRLQTIVDNLH